MYTIYTLTIFPQTLTHIYATRRPIYIIYIYICNICVLYNILINTVLLTKVYGA